MRVEKSWGYEEILHNGDYCCKKLVYTRPIASSLHYHERKHETFVVLSGLFEIQLRNVQWFDDQRQPCEAPPPMIATSGCSIVLPPRTQHRVRCIEPGTIIEASTHDDPADCVRLIPSET